jgi:urease gamma subunit
MFQLKTPVNSIRFAPSEIEVINQRFIEFQEKKGIVFSSLKEMFSTLLNDALNSENIENVKPVEIEKPIPDGFQLITTENNVEFEAVVKEIVDYGYRQGVDEPFSIVSVLKTAIENAEKQPQTVEVEKEVVKTVEKTLENNQILLTLTDGENATIDKKLLLLDEIKNRRFRKYKVEETIPELCEKLIFNDGTIFNLAGEFHTGF